MLLEQTDHQIISWGCHSRRQHTHRPPTAKQVETSGVWEKPFHKWALVNGTEPVMRCCTGDQMASRWEKIYPCILISLLSGFTTRITNLYLCLLLQHMNISLCFTTGGCHEVRLPVLLLLLLLVWIDKCNRGTLVYHERSWRVLYLISLHWSKNYDLFTANAANSLLVGLWRSRTN